jgi:GT2 family glycosyltransferase
VSVERDNIRRTLSASPAPIVGVEPADAPGISFVIVTFGTGRVVVDAIGVAVRAAEAARLTAEVIVVDNAHPTAPDVARRFLLLDTRGVTIVEPGRNLGFGGGCELGILHSRAPIVCLLNPDVSGDGAWLPPLLAAVLDRTNSIAAPVLLDTEGSVQEAGQRILADGWTVADRHPAAGIAEVDFASAACWVVTRDEHERLGGFDPAYHPAYFEDADLAFRARELGGRVVVHGGSRLTHVGGAGTPGTADPTEQHARFLQRHPEVAWRTGRRGNAVDGSTER